MDHNISFITNMSEGEYVPPPQFKEGKKHWNSGPPYLATVRGAYGTICCTLERLFLRVRALHFLKLEPKSLCFLDMYQIAVKWTEYAPRIVDMYPNLYAGEKYTVDFLLYSPGDTTSARTSQTCC